MLKYKYIIVYVKEHVQYSRVNDEVHVQYCTVFYLVEQESSAGGSGEARGDELRPVGQDGVTVGAGEEASSTDMIQEDSPHFTVRLFGKNDRWWQEAAALQWKDQPSKTVYNVAANL